MVFNDFCFRTFSGISVAICAGIAPFRGALHSFSLSRNATQNLLYAHAPFDAFFLTPIVSFFLKCTLSFNLKTYQYFHYFCESILWDKPGKIILIFTSSGPLRELHFSQFEAMNLVFMLRNKWP